MFHYNKSNDFQIGIINDSEISYKKFKHNILDYKGTLRLYCYDNSKNDENLIFWKNPVAILSHSTEKRVIFVIAWFQWTLSPRIEYIFCVTRNIYLITSSHTSALLLQSVCHNSILCSTLSVFEETAFK